jgi:hypothetical protein
MAVTIRDSDETLPGKYPRCHRNSLALQDEPEGYCLVPFSASALTYRDNCAEASATSAGVIVTASRSIYAGSILGSKTHTGPRSLDEPAREHDHATRWKLSPGQFLQFV